MGNKQTSETKENLKAIIDYENGEKYDGEVYNNKRHGFGTYYYLNGEKYEGLWVENKKEGRGTFFMKNGDVYEGFWLNNMKEGIGTYYYNNGDRYFGDWKNNKKNGKGTFLYVDGSTFTGNFKNNNKAGMGEFIAKDGGTFLQEWKGGKLVKNTEKQEEGFNHNFDYKKLNSDNFEKYLESKQKQKTETMEAQLKSRFASIEMVKMIKSQYPEENINENLKLMITSKVKEKPDIDKWRKQDLADLMVELNFEGVSASICASNIDCNELFEANEEDLDEMLNEISKENRHVVINCVKLLKKIKEQHKEYLIQKSTDGDSNLKKHKKSTERFYKDNILKIEEEGNKSDDYFSSICSNRNESNQSERDFDEEKLFNIVKVIENTIDLNGLNFFINFEELNIRHKVGQGGFGEVYLGKWCSKKVAVKKLTLKVEHSAQIIERFINEINIISSLRHPNVVLYMGTAIKNENYFMVTEYLPKGSLFDYIHKQNGRFTEIEQINIAFEMSVALKYLHSKGVLHCDLKSSNILLDAGSKIKIGDFGLSRFKKKMKQGENIGRIGTPHWMAPEILKGGIYTEHADIYSYGMILWELLAREIPYYDMKPYEIAIRVGEKKKILPMPKEGHAELIKLINWCLEYECENRPKLMEIIDFLSKIRIAYMSEDYHLEQIYDFLN